MDKIPKDFTSIKDTYYAALRDKHRCYCVLQPLKMYMWCFKLRVDRVSAIYSGRVANKS